MNLIFNSDKMVAIDVQNIPFSLFHLKDFIATTFNGTIIRYIQNSESVEIAKTNALLFICVFTVFVFLVKTISGKWYQAVVSGLMKVVRQRKYLKFKRRYA